MSDITPVQYDFWPPINLKTCSLSDAGVGIAKSRDRESYIPLHPHGGHFELTCILAGRGTSYAGQTPIPVTAGDIFLSVPREMHRLDSDPTAPLCQAFLTFGILSPKLTVLSDRLWKISLPPQNRVFHDDGLPLLLKLILNELAENRPYQNDVLASLVEQAAWRMLRAFADFSPAPLSVTPSDKELCEHITHYIDTHVYTLRSLSELGDALRYNYSYLSARYKKVAGQTIKEYYTRRRMEEAKSVLRTCHSISRAAEILGYSGVYAFSKAFKSYYGFSPSELFK